MNNNFDIEKFRKVAAVVGEDELDQVLDEDIVGAGSTIPCAKAIAAVAGLVVQATTSFDWCPTGACTSSCRF